MKPDKYPFDCNCCDPPKSIPDKYTKNYHFKRRLQRLKITNMSTSGSNNNKRKSDNNNSDSKSKKKTVTIEESEDSDVAQGLTSYFFRIGSQILPSKNPDNYAEMFAEVVKALGSISDILYTPTISFASYFNSASAHLDTQITTVANMGTTNSGNFCIGIDLENYVNAPKSTIFAGYNSNTDDIFVVMNHTGVQTGTVRYDAYACFDSVLVFENNTCYRKF